MPADRPIAPAVVTPDTPMERCELCFGRGYRGGGQLPTCSRCGGRGEVPVGTRNPSPYARRT